MRITGTEAIEYKKLHPTTELNKCSDPIECELYDISVEYAEGVAREDASLIWCEGEEG